jgi:hypothetical protein
MNKKIETEDPDIESLMCYIDNREGFRSICITLNDQTEIFLDYYELKEIMDFLEN